MKACQIFGPPFSQILLEMHEALAPGWRQMPVISRFYGIIIAMFFEDHNPPHFHARYGSFQVVIKIDNLAILTGEMPPRALGLIMEWAARHQQELKQNWELARMDQPLKKIPPLD